MQQSDHATDPAHPVSSQPKQRSSAESDAPPDVAQLTHEMEETKAELIDEIDDSLELLRSLLFDEYRQQIERMTTEVEQLQTLLDALKMQIQDEDALIDTITPVIAGAIRTNISESREEMIDALYPIMGKLVQRSVAEAMRDLAQRIDQQMRRALDVKSFWRRLNARLRGISDADMFMRDALPLAVDEIFLIHRETGLLLLHLSQDGSPEEDSDIISGMLTAINEFTQDAFGRTDEESLNEIQYGGRSILLEAAHFVYIAVVIDGFESSDFRSNMREVMIAIEHRHASLLRHYNGDATALQESQALLATLLT